MLNLLSEKTALERLQRLKSDFTSEITNTYEHRAKSCLTCETKGACCLDAHFVNVHISRPEAVAIRRTINGFSDEKRTKVIERIKETIRIYDLRAEGDTYAQTFACPLFEKGTGCLVHHTGKPIPCIAHACYENRADLPPDELQAEQERLVDRLAEQTYGRRHQWLSLPLAIMQKENIADRMTEGE